MADRVVDATWLGDYRVDAVAGDFTVRVDEPSRVGGSDTGPQPTDMLLVSIASCFVLSLAYSARKRSIPVSVIEVRAGGTYDGPRFRAIEISVRTDAPGDRVDELLASAERVCYVTNTLRQPPEIAVTHQTVPSA